MHKGVIAFGDAPDWSPEVKLVYAVIERALRDWDRARAGLAAGSFDRHPYREDSMLGKFLFSEDTDGWTLRQLALMVSDDPEIFIATIRDWARSGKPLKYDERFRFNARAA